MLSPIIISAFKSHLVGMSLEDKKELLEAIKNSDKWQECICAIIDMTEEDVFKTEFAVDISSIDTSVLLTHEQDIVIKEDRMRESFERWTQDVTCVDE